MVRLTRSGIPVVGEKTLVDFITEMNAIDSLEIATTKHTLFYNRARTQDSVYAGFIDAASDQYPADWRFTIWCQLVANRELLARAGPLPRLDQARYDEAWKAIGHQSLAVFNVGAHMPVLEAENPYFFRFVIETAGLFPGDLRMPVLADLSSGYFLLVTCAEPASKPTLDKRVH